MYKAEIAVVSVAVACLVALVVFMVVETRASAARNMDCRSIGYSYGMSAGGKDYCVREVVSPRTRDDAR
jgi:hypothetical protein